MERNKLDLAPDKIVGLDLETLVKKASELNRKNQETYVTPFPKNPSRLDSHYHFEPRSITFTSEGEVEGGLSALVGSLFDLSFTRSIFAPHYSKEGGHCFDPASLFFLELAVKLDGYATYSSFCLDLRQQEKGARYRRMAGIETSIPGEDDLSYFRSRIGSEPIDSIVNVFVGFLREFGLIKDEALCSDGQLEPTNSRYRGCAYFCDQCPHLLLTENQRRQLVEQILSGAKRLQITCPFPETVEKVLKATKKKGSPVEPKVALLEIEYLPASSDRKTDTARVARLLGAMDGELPPLRIKWSRLSQDPQGHVLGCCAKAPTDLEAGVGYHIDNRNPPEKEMVFGYLQQRTTSVNVVLNLDLPVASSTYPADTHEGSVFLLHREKVAIPYLPYQVHCLDSGHDQQDIYIFLASKGVNPLIDYNPRRENLSEEALKKRGYDQNGTPYAPCGRLCRSNGYDYGSQSRQYVCGLSCSEEERKLCPHGQKPCGYSHRMSFDDHPRLIGPVQRGTSGWSILYGLRTASERTNSYAQEVIEEGQRPRLRGLKAFKYAGVMATLGQLLRKAMNFILDVTYTTGRLYPLIV